MSAYGHIRSHLNAKQSETGSKIGFTRCLGHLAHLLAIGVCILMFSDGSPVKKEEMDT